MNITATLGLGYTTASRLNLSFSIHLFEHATCVGPLTYDIHSNASIINLYIYFMPCYIFLYMVSSAKYLLALSLQAKHFPHSNAYWLLCLCRGKATGYQSNHYPSQPIRHTTYLARVKYIVWVDRSLDRPHQLNSPWSKFFNQVLFLSNTNAMFAST